MSGFHDYFIRCKQADKPALFTLAAELGILKQQEGVTVPCDPAWVWQEVGAIYKQVGPGPLDVEPSKAPDGSVWWHANLRLTMDLMDHCQAVYAAAPTPELASGLANIGRFFFVDASGRATRPNDPAIVFA